MRRAETIRIVADMREQLRSVTEPRSGAHNGDLGPVLRRAGGLAGGRGAGQRVRRRRLTGWPIPACATIPTRPPGDRRRPARLGLPLGRPAELRTRSPTCTWPGPTYEQVVDGRLAEPGRLSPALLERLAEPLFGLHRDLADRLRGRRCGSRPGHPPGADRPAGRGHCLKGRDRAAGAGWGRGRTGSATCGPWTAPRRPTWWPRSCRPARAGTEGGGGALGRGGPGKRLGRWAAGSGCRLRGRHRGASTTPRPRGRVAG